MTNTILGKVSEDSQTIHFCEKHTTQHKVLLRPALTLKPEHKRGHICALYYRSGTKCSQNADFDLLVAFIGLLEEWQN